MGETLVYTFGGDIFKGRFGDAPLSFWKKEYGGRQNYLYKGFHYSLGEKVQVVVYDNKDWSAQEIARRKDNGFLGIKAYYLTPNVEVKAHERTVG